MSSKDSIQPTSIPGPSLPRVELVRTTDGVEAVVEGAVAAPSDRLEAPPVRFDSGGRQASQVTDVGENPTLRFRARDVDAREARPAGSGVRSRALKVPTVPSNASMLARAATRECFGLVEDA